MQQRGWDVTYLPVSKDGLIDMDQLKDAIREDTAIVSVMYVNNEIGEPNCSPQIIPLLPIPEWNDKLD
jgi:cysteine sulfinate desulfinase/cysteine desulfurase-like protein